jgi:predicted nucleic acid-binding protein
MTVVVDASVLAKLYVDEEHTAEAELLIDNDIDLVAPELAIIEVGNIFWKKNRVGELSNAESHKLIALFLEEDIEYYRHADLIEGALKLATTTEQSVLNCIYLELAISLNSMLVTADRRFFLAMRSTAFKNRIVWIANAASLS